MPHQYDGVQSFQDYKGGRETVVPVGTDINAIMWDDLHG